ncbi:MAG TPA: TonB-dependent receptor [Acidobacteriaceae bacterium]|nr:TonB-dependent receptor [Acidobacteriaceae bacterium]
MKLRVYAGVSMLLYAGFTLAQTKDSKHPTQPEAGKDRAQTAQTRPKVSSTVVVLGSPEPVTEAESSRVVTVIDTKAHPLVVPTVEDYLRTDSSVFIEQRGGGGVQADISLRGSTFEQTLVLLNGLRINDAQTSHHNLDLPVPLEALKAIDVLHGTGSTLYGADAMSGVVDFITAVPTRTSLSLRAGAGSYGENEQAVIADGVRGRWSEALTGERDFSSGFMYDRDYRTEEASSESVYQSSLGATRVLLAGSDRAFGANQFYGNYPSWERTKGWFASVSQKLGSKTRAAFGYRRHTDNFILLRNDPSVYANNHIDTSWQAVVRRKETLGAESGLFYGLDFQGDSIHSNNLGQHARNRGAGYADLDLHFRRRGTLSVGAREELLSGGPESVFSPEISGSLFLGRQWKLRAAGGYGFRLPTYTDLYYSDPTTVGNANLKPESAWSGEGGADWYPGARLEASVTVFYSRQHDAIDYVRADPSQLWRAENLSGVAFTGVESSVNWQATSRQALRFSDTVLWGAQGALHELESLYIFNYPVNNAAAEWTGKFGGFAARSRLEVVERYQQDAYPVWDASFARERGWVHPYLQLTNLSNTGYEEIEGVRMQGRSIVGGVELTLPKR